MLTSAQSPSASTRLLPAVQVPCAALHPRRQAAPRSHQRSLSAAPAPFALRTASLRLGLRCRAAGDDPFDSLFKSDVFKSDIVREEFARVMSDFNTLRTMSPKFPEFDLEGKRMFLDKMEDACGRYEVFLKRLELSPDPAGREYLRATNAQMLEAGSSLHLMVSGVKQSLDMYRMYIQQEERAAADPVAHQTFLKGLRVAWGSSTLEFMDITRMDPNNIMRAQKDPQFWRAIKEIREDPEMMSAWKDHDNIGPLVREMWKVYKQQQ